MRDKNRPDPAHELLESVDPLERTAVLHLLRDELARGWVPRRADIEAALHVVRRRGG